MNATIIREKRQTTLPDSVCKAAGLHVKDYVDWRFEGGEIRGRKLEHPKTVFSKGKLVLDKDLGFHVWDGDLGGEVADAVIKNRSMD